MRLTFALVVVLFLPGCVSTDQRTPEQFERWRAQHAETVAAFDAFLHAHAIDSVIASHELLRSASVWAECEAEPFAVPPPAQWPSVRVVLELVRELQTRGVLRWFEVHSAYRDAALNQCAGGAKSSAHFFAFALDLTAWDSDRIAQKLCSFWAVEGDKWRMGLSRYPSGRIHIDANGYRTWGADGTAKSSYCVKAH